MQSFETLLFIKTKVYDLTVKQPHILVCAGFKRRLKNNHFLVYLRLWSGMTRLKNGIKDTFYGID